MSLPASEPGDKCLFFLDRDLLSFLPLSWKLFWEQNDNSLACIRPAPSTGQSVIWLTLRLSPRTGLFFWDAQGRGFLAKQGEENQARWGPPVSLPKEPASLCIFHEKNNKGERQKTESDGVDWWQEKNNVFLKNQSL